MNNDFKKAGYFSAIAIFIIGITALVISTAASYFAYDAAIILVGQLVSVLSFLGLLIIGVKSKHKYNRSCIRFAEYILNNKKKESERNAHDAERAKELQNMQAAAAQERENAVAAALEQGRSEGAAQAAHAAQANQIPPFAPRMMPAPVEAYPAYVQQISPTDEVLYNEYGEPVMIRRRVKKQRAVQNGEVQYDRFGKPIAQTAVPAAPVVSTPTPVPVSAPTPVPAPVTIPASTENQIYTPDSASNQIYTPASTSSSIYTSDSSNNQIYTPESEKIPIADDLSLAPKPINVDPYRIDL